MDIGFVWDETKYKKVLKKHGVKFYEVVSAFDDPNAVETWEQVGYEERWVWIGRTPSDRLLVVIYTDEDLPLKRIVTAFDAKGRWENEYYGR